MPKQNISVFKPYPFRVGQKINIASGPRKGDWEVVAVDERKVTLRCPISQKAYTWNRFCYFAEQKDRQWPDPD